MQLKRFHDRRHSPLTSWKFSPMDVAGMTKWDDYTRGARPDDREDAHRACAVDRRATNDKRRARIEVIRHVLRSLDYTGRDVDAIGEPDRKIIGDGPASLQAQAVELAAAGSARRRAIGRCGVFSQWCGRRQSCQTARQAASGHHHPVDRREQHDLPEAPALAPCPVTCQPSSRKER